MIRRTCLKTFRSNESVLLEVKASRVTPILTSFSVHTNKINKDPGYPFSSFNGRFYIESNELQKEIKNHQPIFLYACATTDGRHNLSTAKLKWVENHFRSLFPHMTFGPLKSSSQ